MARALAVQRASVRECEEQVTNHIAITVAANAANAPATTATRPDGAAEHVGDSDSMAIDDDPASGGSGVDVPLSVVGVTPLPPVIRAGESWRRK